jgi:hypothetical protein
MSADPRAGGGRCRDCRHFIDDAETIERELPGILALSSAAGDTRGDQGLCRIHDRLLMPHMSCDLFAERTAR